MATTAEAAAERTTEQQLVAVREKISQYEDQLDRAQDREMILVLHQRLVKLQEKELLLMQQQQQPGNHQLAVGRRVWHVLVWEPSCTTTACPQVHLRGRLIC
jgi:hypothetical protein